MNEKERLEQLKDRLHDMAFPMNEKEMVTNIKSLYSAILRSRSMSPSPHGSCFSCPWPDLYEKDTRTVRNEMERIADYLWVSQQHKQHSWSWFERVASEKDIAIFKAYTAYKALV